MKPTQMRWTMEAAAREFGRSRTMVAARLAGAGIVAGPDGCYSTMDICRALFGSIQDARLREANARAGLAEAREKILLKQFLPVELVERTWETMTKTMLARLNAVPDGVGGKYRPGMPNAELIAMIRGEIHAACADIAHADYILPDEIAETETDTEI